MKRKGWVVEGVGYLPLTHNRVALVDPTDVPWLEQWNWCVQSKGYAYRSADAGKTSVLLHRFIMGTPSDRQVDHKNMDKLDCRRDNLRLATALQNNVNRPVQPSSTLGVKGVAMRGARFAVRMKVHGKWKRFGSYATLAEADHAYRNAARALHGEFAYTGDE